MNKTVILALAGVGLLISCMPGTLITGTWKSPDARNPVTYENVLVAALTGNVKAKAKVENDIAEALREKGLKVYESIDLFPPNFSDNNNDKEKMLSRIRKNGTEAILTVSLIDKDTESRYVPGASAYAPFPTFGHYGMFWGYYSFWYPRMYGQPGYYAEDKIYYLETNLYDAETERLLWSAQSETYNPAALEHFSEDFAKVIVEEMEEDEVLI